MQCSKRISLQDTAVILFGAAVVGTYCVVFSRHRLMWSDELFGWMLCSDPSWTHMWRAWNLGADGGGIGFYTLCRLWLKIFGRSTLSFRLFSAAGILLGFAATWLSLRRFYHWLPAFLALTTVWFGSRILLWHVLQTRFYGLLVGMVASALWVLIRSEADAEEFQTQRRSTIVFALLINLVLVSTHPFGLFYSGLLLFAGGISDVIARRRRPQFYAAALLSWSILLVSRTAMASSARVGKPWFWTTRPGLSALKLTYRPESFRSVLPFAVCLIGAVLVSLFWRQKRSRIAAGLVSRRDLLIPATLLFFAPVFFWIGSQFSTSYYVERYFSPFTIGIAVLFAELATMLYSRPFRSGDRVPYMLFGTLSTCAFFINVQFCMRPYARGLEYPPNRNQPKDLLTMLPGAEPIVLQRADIFDVTRYYVGEGARAPESGLYTPIDWPLALSPASPKWLVSATHEMENWKLAGYFSDNIVDSADFLRTHRHFVVVEDDIDPWFHKRIATQPGWHVQKIGRFEDPLWASTIWDVTR